LAAPRRALAAKLILALATPAIATVATVAATGAAHRPAAVGAPPRTTKMPARRAPAPAPAPAVPPPADPLAVKRILPIGPIRFGEYAWDAKGVPDGPLIVTVDLAAQTLSVFRGGYEIGATAILYGADDKPTPLGTFPILMKDADHVSATYGAPMPYTLRLTADGVSVHGTEVAWGYATHGCIGVPTAFARLLFREAKPGDKVIITRGRTLATGEALIG